MVKLTILMPCLNEENTLASCIKKAQKWSAKNNIDTEILIADNGSTDSSVKIAIELGARVIEVEERGYGATLRAGLENSLGEWIIFGDADDSYDFSNLTPFIEKFEEGYDLVMGNRFMGGISPGAMPWKNRHIGNPGLSWLARTMHKIPIGDFHCGLRGISRKGLSRITLKTTGMELASEIVIRSSKAGLRITEVPTTLSKDGRDRKSHLRPWRDGIRHAGLIIYHKFSK
jgi:glycosyltransferase involved in cell wall biosynthesis